MSDPGFFVVGGTLSPDEPCYVERAADTELLKRLKDGEFCYVLTARQMGKSSLMARTAAKLRNEGTRTAILDLTEIGKKVGQRDDEERWVYGCLHVLRRELGLTEPLKTWWARNSLLPPIQRFSEYLREAVPSTDSNVVVFIDEIDSMIGLPFAHNFFAALRALHNARAAEPNLKHLSAVLLGVASPDELIPDENRTPFNVGTRIDLSMLTAEQARDWVPDEEVLREIIGWTGGQPYLTQALCKLVAEHPGVAIYELATESFLTSRAVREDPHLRNIKKRLVAEPRPRAKARLMILRQVLRGEMVADEPISPVITSLKLSGVVIVGDDGYLQMACRIYERVFDETWVTEAIPDDLEREANVLAQALRLDTYGDFLLSRRAATEMGYMSTILAIIFAFNLFAWSFLFNAIIHSDAMTIDYKTFFAAAGGLLFAYSVLIYDRQFIVADTSQGWRRGALSTSVRLSIIIASAIITAQPIELLIFRAAITQRINEEGVRRHAISLLPKLDSLEQQAEDRERELQEIQRWIQRLASSEYDRSSNRSTQIAGVPYQYISPAYNFFEQLRVLDDLRKGRTAPWPAGSTTEQIRRIGDEFAIQDPRHCDAITVAHASGSGQERPCTFAEQQAWEGLKERAQIINWSWLAVYAAAVTIPLLVIAIKFLQSAELTAYYSARHQAAAGNPAAITSIAVDQLIEQKQ